MGQTFDVDRDQTGEELAGRYVLLQRLASGPLSSVYQAQDAKLMRRVVVRLPGRDAIQADDFAEGFERAVRSISDLEHDGLVGVVDFGEHEGVPFAVVHHVTGSSLAARLADQGHPQTTADVASWLPQVASTLDYLHGKHEAHGGVEPDSIILDESPSTKAYLTDFTVHRAIGGADAQKDQRDLATCVLWALHGERPASPDQVDPERLGPRAAGEAVMRAASEQPFESCSEFADAFVAGLEAAPPAAPSGPMPTRADSETLGFGRPRPAAPSAPADAAEPSADPFATREVMMRGRKKSSNSLALGVLGLLLLGAILFVVFGSGRDKDKGNVAKDEVAPTLELLQPSDGKTTREAEVTVLGKTDDPKAIVLIDENPVPVGEDGRFETITRIPKEGEQKIVILARDEAGNETRKVLVVTRDATPPTLEIVAPSPEVLATPTTAPTIVVSGIVSESDAEVEVGGTPVEVGADGQFSREIEIPRDGENVIEIVARDTVGNVVSQNVVALRRLVICCDTLSITAPLDGDATQADEIELLGKMEDPRATIEINGEAVALDRDGVFRGVVSLENEGVHEIVVRAHDEDGHLGEARVLVTRDLTPPTLDITEPKVWVRDPTKVLGTSARPLKLAGTVEDATRCTIFVNGRRGSVTGSTWEATVDISVGEKFARVWAVDAAGNVSETQKYPLFVPRAKVRGLTYKGTNEEGGYDEYTLDKDPTVVLVVAPQGGYVRGVVPGDAFAEPDEKPRQWVTISAFLISRTEITWAQYLRFCKASDYQLPPGISERGLLLDHPVTQVTWADAKAYCKWAGLRLLTESEWEFAARFGTDGGVWPWGSTWVEEPANVASMRGNTTSVASYDATGDLKLHDMVGNVGEWCEDWYAENEYDELPERDPMGPKSGTTRVVRGGSWQHPKKEARLSARRGVEPDTRHAELGFRVGMNATIR